MNEAVLATDGRKVGTRGKATRGRLLNATSRLLAERGVFDLKVVDVTRSVGSSPATFYQYFTDVEAAILALCDEATEDAGALLQVFTQPWTEASGMQLARRFIDEFLRYWDEHQAVLRVRNLKSEEGDRRFRDARQRGYIKLMEGLVREIQAGQKSGRVSDVLHPYATAAGVLAVIERLLAFQAELGRRGVSRAALRETLAGLVFQILTGRRP